MIVVPEIIRVGNLSVFLEKRLTKIDGSHSPIRLYKHENQIIVLWIFMFNLRVHVVAERRTRMELLKRLRMFPAVGLIGPRQSGKTTRAKHIVGLLPSDSVYLDLALPSDRNRLRDPEMYLRTNLDSLVVVDGWSNSIPSLQLLSWIDGDPG